MQHGFEEWKIPVIETDNHDWPVIGGRPDRLIILIVGLLIVNFVAIKGLIIQLTLGLITVVSFIGLIQRIIYARGLIKKAEKEGTILSYIRKK